MYIVYVLKAMHSYIWISSITFHFAGWWQIFLGQLKLNMVS